MLQQTLFEKIESFGRKSLTLHVNLKRKTSIICKYFLTQAWNFTWNLQQCEKLSLTHLKLHTFNTQRTFFHTPQTFNESKNSLPHTFTLKFNTFKNLKNKFFTLERLTTLWRNLFHTSHSLRNGLLLFLQPWKLKAFPQKDFPFLCYTSSTFDYLLF